MGFKPMISVTLVAASLTHLDLIAWLRTNSMHFLQKYGIQTHVLCYVNCSVTDALRPSNYIVTNKFSLLLTAIWDSNPCPLLRQLFSH